MCATITNRSTRSSRALITPAASAQQSANITNPISVQASIGKTLKFKTNCGIGDFMTVKCQLTDFVNNGNTVYLSPNLDIVKGFGNTAYDAQYTEFMFDFMKTIFNEKGFIITEDQSYPPVNYFILKSMGYPAKLINLTEQLVDNNYDFHIKEPYITISTKIRGIKDHIFNNLKSQLFDTINKLNCKVVLVGERNIAISKEYDTVGKNMVYSIYNDLIGDITNDKMVDMCVDSLQVPSVAQLRKDCKILNGAMNNIIFGIGGNFSITRSVGRCITFMSKDSDYWREYNKSLNEIFDKNDTEHLLLNDWDVFLSKLSQIK